MSVQGMEKRIHYSKPPWAGLQEISRNDRMVTFKTATGTRSVPLRAVLDYEKSLRNLKEGE